MKRVVLGLGTNLGDRRENLRAALAALSHLPKTEVENVSSVWQTAPFDVPDEQQDYWNICVSGGAGRGGRTLGRMLFCILLLWVVLPLGSCRRMAEKAQRNIRLEAVEKARRQGLSGAEIVLRIKNGTGHKLKLEKASLTVYYAGGVVTKVALREPAEAPRRATASVTTLWRIRTSDPMALHVMTKKIREDDISKIGVSFAIEGRGGPARVKISREMMPLSEFLNIFGLSLNDVKNYLEE